MRIKVSSCKDTVDPLKFEGEYEVYAIMDFTDGTKYLVYDTAQLLFMDQRNTIIIDDTISNRWIDIEFGKGIWRKSPYFNFTFKVQHYQGPQEFWDDQIFFFEVIDGGEHVFDLFNEVYPDAFGPKSIEKTKDDMHSDAMGA